MVEKENNLYILYSDTIDKMSERGRVFRPAEIFSAEVFLAFPEGIQESIIRDLDPTFNESNPFSGCPKKGSF